MWADNYVSYYYDIDIVFHKDYRLMYTRYNLILYLQNKIPDLSEQNKSGINYIVAASYIGCKINYCLQVAPAGNSAFWYHSDWRRFVNGGTTIRIYDKLLFIGEIDVI